MGFAIFAETESFAELLRTSCLTFAVPQVGIKQALDKGHMNDSHNYSVAAAHSDCYFASGPC